MSYNQNFFNNFSGNYTFREGMRPPCFNVPPPMPPQYYLPPPHPPQLSDQEFLKTFESKILPKQSKENSRPIYLTEVREHLRKLMTTFQDIKNDENKLNNEMGTLTDDEWSTIMMRIEEKKARVEESMKNINNCHLDTVRKLLAKRTAKRQRLKRLRIKQKMEKEDRVRKLQERSRKIDENLQKIKDDIVKAKQEEELKFQTDIVLKEVSKKKHDAKKCLSKLDALVKLRKARLNTARGSGITIPDCDTDGFNQKIDNLRSLWVKKLSVYEIEEKELVNNVALNQEKNSGADLKEKEVAGNLSKWRNTLFGEKNMIPQVDFGGDLSKFIAVRCQWDEFINSEGSTIPIGWIVSPK